MKYAVQMRRWVAICMVILSLATMAQAEGIPAIVVAQNMPVYADSGFMWPLGSLPVTTVVTLEASVGNVAAISLGENKGYAAMADLLKIEDIATVMEFNTDSRVYQAPKLSSRWLPVDAGLEVNLLATHGAWAMVEREGIVAYTNRYHLSEVIAQEEPQFPQIHLPTPSSPTVVEETFAADIVSDVMRVYKSPSTASQAIGLLPGGIQVTVRAYCGDWAYIELGGNGGYAAISDLKRAVEANPVPSENYLTSDKYSTEKKCYLFLTRELRFNTAAACGVLANIERECDFDAQNLSSDGGYGLCQWTGARSTRLKNWCAEKGYDYTTVEGQMWYLKYELENHYKSTLSYMREVENSPAGAYLAGYYWCYNFEIPASRAKRSVERGNIAKETYWHRYTA